MQNKELIDYLSRKGFTAREILSIIAYFLETPIEDITLIGLDRLVGAWRDLMPEIRRREDAVSEYFLEGEEEPE